MAHYVLLINCDSNDPSAPFTEKDELVAEAKYMLPILWCSLYAQEDICTRIDHWSEQRIDGTEEQHVASYPVLLTSLETAQRRAIERRAVFFAHVPARLDNMYNEWVRILDGLVAPFLRVNTGELWSLMKPEVFDEMLRQCVRAFEENRLEDWRTLIEQAPHLEFDPATRQVSLIGEYAAHDMYGSYLGLKPRG